jgi:plastocyanin
VQIGDNFFQPGTVTVKVGEKVTWSWSGAAPHSVLGTFDGKEVKSETKTGTGTFEFTFTKAGTFDYACGIHGPLMPGKIVIQ